MNRPSSARRICAIFVGRACQPRNHFCGGELQDAGDVGVVRQCVDGIGIPPGVLQRGNEFASTGLRGVDGGAVVVAILGQAQRLAQPRHSLLAAEQLPCSQYGQHQIEFDTVRGLFTENVKAIADLDILDLAEPAVDVQQHVVERVVLWPLVKAEVVVHLCRAHQRPDLLTDRGQLARVERGDGGVLVEQLLQSRDVAVGFGACHRWNEVVDQRGVRAALGLGALPRVVHQERVDQRQVAQCGVGAARRGHAKRLAGQPLQVAVLAEVHNRVRAENGADPVVGGQIVVAGWQVGVVVDGDRVLAESPRRLDHQHHVAGLKGGDDDLAVAILTSVDEQLTRRRPPVRDDRVGELPRQRAEPVTIVLGGQPDRIARQLPVGEPVRVLAAALDQGVDQRVPVLGVHAGNVADLVPRVAHRP